MKLFQSMTFGILGLWLISINVIADQDADRKKVEHDLRHAMTYMQSLQQNGGWATKWSSDLKLTWGEHAIRPREIITVQPPATPGIGGLFLRAYQVLNDPDYLKIAIAAGDALINGQLDCGGFPHEFVPGDSKKKSGSFDDDVTQGATRFLIDLYNISGEERFAKAARNCARFMLDSQYPNGGWPQAFPLGKGYSRYITLNDRAMMDVMRTLFLCYHQFGDKRYYDAALRGADCLIALQGKSPQGGWAQQYEVNGTPAPARRFEPVALSSSESVGVLKVMLDVYKETNNAKYLLVGPEAFEWLRNSKLPNGKWARFYELKSNRPLYCTPEGKIVFDVALARPGYSWQGNYFSSSLEKTYIKLLISSSRAPYKPNPKKRRTAFKDIEPYLKSLDKQGRWISQISSSAKQQYQDKIGDPSGVGIIQSGVFVRNADRLLDYLE
jgi:pectate lyase-like protein